MNYEEQKKHLEDEIKNKNHEMEELIKMNLDTIRKGIRESQIKIDIKEIKKKIFSELLNHIIKLESIAEYEAEYSILNCLKMKDGCDFESNFKFNNDKVDKNKSYNNIEGKINPFNLRNHPVKKFNKIKLDVLFTIRKLKLHIERKINKDENNNKEKNKEKYENNNIDDDHEITVFININDNIVKFYDGLELISFYKGSFVEKNELIANLFERDFKILIKSQEMFDFSLNIRISRILDFIKSSRNIKIYSKYQYVQFRDNNLCIKHYCPLINEVFEENDEIRGFIMNCDDIFSVNYLLMMAPHGNINLKRFNDREDYYFIKWKEFFS
ncbi:hypothetical protein DMUE_0331 [Dictyocoela muelleri]|nr:hypothetical protein DMUE_0331 [Dictyocoela muelleri]